ncbi:Far upstream element-binding protein like [Melia azedarach]|uniref:Far upstream element-binding protein like n=1 Tax=Melia azedarach TaxID=155640 RepID=A0ACC1XBU3_MELAZ|nr:Far upstream element-binding protein like [Melia azedarach]
MADEPQYSSDTTPNKRKYEDQTTPPSSGGRRPTGFSSGPPLAAPNSAAAPPSYNSVPPPVDDFQAAKRRAEQIAARLLNSAPADAKRPRVENGSGGYDSGDRGFSSPPSDVKPNPATSAIPVSYGGFQGMGTSKKIEIPNIRVGVIIGKSGETIKYLQLQSGAKIQVTRDTEADLNSPTRSVELMGTPEQIAKAEQLINDVLAEAEAGGSGIVARRLTGQAGSDHFVMKIPNNKVGLVIGKGGETIKNMQARTGARIQVIPLHLPPGDTSTERTVQIDGTNEQIENAKQLVNEVISENRLRNPAMTGGYPQQGYQARPPTNWGTPGAPPMQQPGYGYVQPGAYPGATPQYNMSQPPYGGYPSQPTSGGYPGNWDQSSVPASQQTSQGSGYDYYGQQPSSQQAQAPGGSAAPADSTGYNYNQPPASAYNQQGQGYAQDGYGGYHAPQSGYGQPAPYDQQQGYNSATSYGNVTNSTQEAHTPSYAGQGDSSQAPPPVQPSPMGQQGYGTSQQPSPNPASYPPQGASQPGYGVPPTSQSGYGSQAPAQSGYPSYGLPQAQKPPTNPPVYGQTQQSPGSAGGYGQPGYAHSQPPTSGYAQADSGPQRSSYGGAASQTGYGPSTYGAPPASQPGYGQGPASYNSYGGGYTQQPVYSADGNATSAAQPVQQSGVTKSPQS